VQRQDKACVPGRRLRRPGPPRRQLRPEEVVEDADPVEGHRVLAAAALEGAPLGLRHLQHHAVQRRRQGPDVTGFDDDGRVADGLAGATGQRGDDGTPPASSFSVSAMPNVSTKSGSSLVGSS
jgi:hypothetical protein